MRRSEALQGVRMLRFRDILGRYESNEFNQMEAAARREGSVANLCPLSGIVTLTSRGQRGA
jgi:hypothetical protein